jgi:hypothetical protein
LVWADEDGKAKGGLHANFKLSGKGENIILAQRKSGVTSVIDFLAFEDLKKDESISKTGRSTAPTPGQ